MLLAIRLTDLSAKLQCALLQAAQEVQSQGLVNKLKKKSLYIKYGPGWWS
jgi:hypothetical protein